MGTGRTGAPADARAASAGAAAGPSQAAPPKSGARATHLGIRWQRHPSGVLRWWDSDTKRWVAYRRGDDAPPRPPGWEAERRGAGPATDRTKRASWRSPYRIVPLVIFVAIIIIGLVAFHASPADQAKAEAAATAKLRGACLHQNGTSGGHPEYASKAVSCATPEATVKVVEVLPGTPGSPRCPAGQTSLVVPYPGVRYPHQLCTAPVTHAG